jgi:hypothetical protein
VIFQCLSQGELADAPAPLKFGILPMGAVAVDGIFEIEVVRDIGEGLFEKLVAFGDGLGKGGVGGKLLPVFTVGDGPRKSSGLIWEHGGDFPHPGRIQFFRTKNRLPG